MLNVMMQYMRVSDGPRKARIRKTMIGFRRGDANRKAMHAPKGTFELIRPTRRGIVEQEQNGVSAPKKAPTAVPVTQCLVESVRLIFSSGTYSWIRPTKKLTARKRRTNSAVMIRKNSPAVTRSLMAVIIILL